MYIRIAAGIQHTVLLLLFILFSYSIWHFFLYILFCKDDNFEYVFILYIAIHTTKHSTHSTSLSPPHQWNDVSSIKYISIANLIHKYILT